MITSRNIFLLLVAIAIGQMAYFYADLPATLASHFNASGIADGWSSKPTFFTVYGLILAMTTLIFLWLPGKFESKPLLRLKIPNRDYWLAPERQEQTLARFKGMFLVMGIAHLLLMVICVQLVIEANLRTNPLLDSRINIALGAYFIFVTMWMIWLILAFRIRK